MQVSTKPVEGTKDRWEIVIEGEKWRVVHQAIFERQSSFPTASSWSHWHNVFNELLRKGYTFEQIQNALGSEYFP